MKRTWVKVIAIVLALALCGAGAAFAEKAKKPAKEADTTKMLLDSFDLVEKGQYPKAEKLLNAVLKKDPGNPLALNNLASIKVQQKKFDKADTLLKQALPKAKGYMVQVNKVCKVGGICNAYAPVTGSAGNEDLEPLINKNIEMVKGYMTAGPLPGSGLR